MASQKNRKQSSRKTKLNQATHTHVNFSLVTGSINRYLTHDKVQKTPRDPSEVFSPLFSLTLKLYPTRTHCKMGTLAGSTGRDDEIGPDLISENEK